MSLYISSKKALEPPFLIVINPGSLNVIPNATADFFINPKALSASLSSYLGLFP